jgi:hypothetical protein
MFQSWNLVRWWSTRATKSELRTRESEEEKEDKSAGEEANLVSFVSFLFISIK